MMKILVSVGLWIEQRHRLPKRKKTRNLGEVVNVKENAVEADLLQVVEGKISYKFAKILIVVKT